jgi:hypothetical protein
VTDGVRTGPRLPLRRSTPPVEEKKHVIAEYRHRAQEVTCVCGWIGSSSLMADGRTSDWSRHVAAYRTGGG